MFLFVVVESVPVVSKRNCEAVLETPQIISANRLHVVGRLARALATDCIIPKFCLSTIVHLKPSLLDIFNGNDSGPHAGMF
jgi:hypothetical protein